MLDETQQRIVIDFQMALPVYPEFITAFVALANFANFLTSDRALLPPPAF